MSAEWQTAQRTFGLERTLELHFVAAQSGQYPGAPSRRYRMQDARMCCLVCACSCCVPVLDSEFEMQRELPVPPADQ